MDRCHTPSSPTPRGPPLTTSPSPSTPQVLSVDIREQKPDKLLLLKNEKEKKVPIYSVHSSPANSNLFCTAGKEQFVRIFDRR